MNSLIDLEKKINSELNTKINKSEIKHDQIYLEIDKEDLIDVILFLKTNKNTKFRQLIDITVVDYPEQIQRFKDMLKKSGVPEEFVILRDRWYTKTENFGVKLTNRAGTIKTGNQIANDVHTTCYYPSYQFLIDWNGDVFLCPQDWQRRQTMGNIMQEEVFDIWTSKIIIKYRVDLLQ